MKGSLLDRKVKLNERDGKFWRRKLHTDRVLKDLNFLEISKDLDFNLVDLNPIQLAQLKIIISRDSEFLRAHGLMDYSMLMVVETRLVQEEVPFSLNDEENIEMKIMTMIDKSRN